MCLCVRACMRACVRMRACVCVDNERGGNQRKRKGYKTKYRRKKENERNKQSNKQIETTKERKKKDVYIERNVEIHKDKNKYKSMEEYK